MELNVSKNKQERYAFEQIKKSMLGLVALKRTKVQVTTMNTYNLKRHAGVYIRRMIYKLAEFKFNIEKIFYFSAKINIGNDFEIENSIRDYVALK